MQLRQHPRQDQPHITPASSTDMVALSDDQASRRGALLVVFHIQCPAAITYTPETAATDPSVEHHSDSIIPAGQQGLSGLVQCTIGTVPTSDSMGNASLSVVLQEDQLCA